MPRTTKLKYLIILAGFSILLIIQLPFSLTQESEKESDKEPNVILIACETLRADHLGFNGYNKKDISKNIDALAEKSFVFKKAYSQAPCTVPSMWNIVTSKYQTKEKVENEHITIAEYFKRLEYKTGAFLSHHYLEDNRANLNQGFDIYDSKITKDKHLMSDRRAHSVVTAAMDWIEKVKGQPFFIWFVLFDPHDPYLAPRGFKGYYNKKEEFNGDRRDEKLHGLSRPISKKHREFLINAYDEEIRYLDHQIGRLLNYLKEINEFNNTIIILTADHGEELGDNANRWDHCMLLSQEEIWIPLLIKMPEQDTKVEINKAVQNIDIYPTLVDYLSPGSKPLFYSTLEGKSLLSFIKGRNPAQTRFAASFWRNQRCIIKGRYKYWLKGPKESLIDLETKKEISNPALFNNLKQTLEKIYNKYIVKKQFYDDTVERLKSIGYIN